MIKNYLFELIECIYNKTTLPENFNVDTSFCVILSKYLSMDRNNLPFLKKIISYIFNINPNVYIYLLWLSIPKKSKVPFLKKIDKIEKKNDKLYEEIKETLDWSERELEMNRSILDKIILPKKEYWMQKLGVKICLHVVVIVENF
jgi:hypothetical protein